MRPAAFIVFAAVVFTAAAVRNIPLAPAEAGATDAANKACALIGAAVQGGGCLQPFLDSTPAGTLGRFIFPGACADGDLHVVRYVLTSAPEGGAAAAAWCE